MKKILLFIVLYFGLSFDAEAIMHIPDFFRQPGHTNLLVAMASLIALLGFIRGCIYRASFANFLWGLLFALLGTLCFMGLSPNKTNLTEDYSGWAAVFGIALGAQTLLWFFPAYFSHKK